MNFAELAANLDRMEATTKRNELVAILSEVYAACTPDELRPVTYLIQGRLAPFFEPIEIGLGERLLVSAMAMAYGTAKEEVDATYRQLGDLGAAAQPLAPASPESPPSVLHAHRRPFETAGHSR